MGLAECLPLLKEERPQCALRTADVKSRDTVDTGRPVSGAQILEDNTTPANRPMRYRWQVLPSLSRAIMNL
jgi:hypothetical protein